MTTVVNNPGGGSGDSGGAGIVLGVLLAIVLIGLFFVYGLPAMRGNQAPQNGSIDVNVQLPTGTPSPAPAPAY